MGRGKLTYALLMSIGLLFVSSLVSCAGTGGQQEAVGEDPWRRQNAELQEKLAEAERNISRLSVAVAARDQTIRALHEDIKGILKAATDLEKARGSFEEYLRSVGGKVSEPPPSLPIVDGKVVKVDQKLNVVVINKGEKDRVRMNLPFTIYRGTDFVAKVYVIDVHAEYCVARVERGIQKGKTQVGDSATTRIY